MKMGDASTMSQLMIISHPPPTAIPLTAKTGLLPCQADRPPNLESGRRPCRSSGV